MPHRSAAEPRPSNALPGARATLNRHHRRARSAALLAAAALVLAACTTGTPSPTLPAPDSSETILPSPTPEPPPELPRGGRTIFPEYRLVGYSGIKGDVNEDLGRLTGDLNARCLEIERIGKRYARGRQVMPVFEMIAVVVQASPGADGKYRVPRPYSEVREYLRAARRCKALLLLNIQPGQSEFLPEMKHFEKLLKEPDVGVALDPEWAMNPGQVPGRVMGHSSGAELNAAADYLQKIVDQYNLPQKAMVFHQFNLNTVSNLKALKPHDGVAIIRSVDGLGGPQTKTEEFHALTKKLPKYIHPGFKLFYKEDTNPPWGSRLMTPKEVMALKPQPEYILYE